VALMAATVDYDPHAPRGIAAQAKRHTEALAAAAVRYDDAPPEMLALAKDGRGLIVAEAVWL